MSDNRIANAAYGDMTSYVTNYSIPAVSTDGPTGSQETEWINSDWGQYLGYYKSIPELQSAIDAKANWTIGKGFQSSELTTLTLMKLKGDGKDTFNSIIENMIRNYHIGGDAFAEIIRDDEGMLVNLKPLDPSTIKIVANNKGLIIRYEQVSKTKKGEVIKFEPDEILHLSRNRVADEIHGTSLIPAVENIILMRNEAMADQKLIMHRYAKPRFIHKLDTDDNAEIAAYKIKADIATDKGENLYIPKGSVEAELLSVPANSTLNPLPWIDRLNSYFFQACGVPQIIVGGSQEMTEATAKIAYLAFEQTIQKEQLYIEEQVLAQLNLEIELEFPASLKNEMLSSESKSETMQATTPEDTGMTGAGMRPAGVQ